MQVTASEYLIREDSPNSYTMSKWEDRKQPSAVYQLRQFKNHIECDCPGAMNHKHCKHVEVLKKWIKEGKKTEVVEAIVQAGIEVVNGKVKWADFDRVVTVIAAVWSKRLDNPKDLLEKLAESLKPLSLVAMHPKFMSDNVEDSTCTNVKIVDDNFEWMLILNLNGNDKVKWTGEEHPQAGYLEYADNPEVLIPDIKAAFKNLNIKVKSAKYSGGGGTSKTCNYKVVTEQPPKVSSAAASEQKVELPVTDVEFYRIVESQLSSILKKKKVEKVDKRKGKNSVSIQFYFDLKDFNGEKKSQWSENSSWLAVGIMEVKDSWGHPALQFYVEYTNGDPGSNNKKLVSLMAAPFESPNRRSGTGEVWTEFVKRLSRVKLEELFPGEIKGPSYWND